MGFCLSKCSTGIDFIHDPSAASVYERDNTTSIPYNNPSNSVFRLPYDRSVRMHTDIEKVCRICFCEDEIEELENFCDCNGSIRWMHRKCLIQWIETSGNSTCRICNAEFDLTKKVSKPTFSLPIPAVDPIEDDEIIVRSRHNMRVYSNNLRNRSVENVIEQIGYDPIINIPGSMVR